MLEVSAVSALYGDLPALWDISLEVRDAEIVALIGANGAGKTTLLRSIAGLHRPASGSIRLDGQPIHNAPAHRIVERGVILVPEGRRLFTAMTVLENLEVGAHSGRARAHKARTMERVYEIFPVLAERRNSVAGTLSGGMQQMLAIGRALMGLPRLLMLDEPSLGLAPLIVQNIFDVVSMLNREGVTVLLVEQNARAALELAHRAYVIEQGRVAGQGAGAEMLANQNVREAYLGSAPAPIRLGE